MPHIINFPSKELLSQPLMVTF